MAASFGRMTAALASATNEFSLAAANFNIDFSLMKIEAPMEFQALGKELSGNRKADAETGSFHVTARRLGALFEGILPKTPKLFEAYGLRSSEISQSADINQKGPERDGIFALHAGMDGTSIWAAATSGRSAIAVHLLACMLARIWTAPEATSIWVQIIEGRRQEIAARFESGAEMRWETFNAARPELTRKQMAEWDASARAWLRAADQAMTKRQKQLILIVNNVGLPVNNVGGTYESVKHAWITSLSTLEKVVQGMPYDIHDGAVLLALMSWHLYPDMIVIGSSVQRVLYGDHLVAPGGQITIGLQDSTVKEGGLKWSLSLAHLRYYGDPLVVKRSAGLDSSRVTFKEFTFAVLGSVLSDWNLIESDQVNIDEVAEALVLLKEVIGETTTSRPGLRAKMNHHLNRPWVGNQNSAYSQESRKARELLASTTGWLGLLAGAADDLLETTGLDRQLALRLVKLGMRSARRFLFLEGIPPEPLFGLTSINNILCLMEDYNERIDLLRKLAQDLGLAGDRVVIRFSLSSKQPAKHDFAAMLENKKGNLKPSPETRKGTSMTSGDSTKNEASEEQVSDNSSKDFGFATAVASQCPSSKMSESRTTDRLPAYNHMRWIPRTALPEFQNQIEPNGGQIFSFDHNYVSVENDFYYVSWLHPPPIFSSMDFQPRITLITNSEMEQPEEVLSRDKEVSASKENLSTVPQYSDRMDSKARNESQVPEEEYLIRKGVTELPPPKYLSLEEDTAKSLFHFFAGDPTVAALYLLDGTLPRIRSHSAPSSSVKFADTNLEAKDNGSKETEQEDSDCKQETTITDENSPEDNEKNPEDIDNMDDASQLRVTIDGSTNIVIENSEDEENSDSEYHWSQGIRSRKMEAPKIVKLSDVTELLRSGVLSTQRLIEHFALLCDESGGLHEKPELSYHLNVRDDYSSRRKLHDDYSEFFKSLKAICCVSEIYKLLGGATVDLNVLSMNLAKAKWVPTSSTVTSNRQTIKHYPAFVAPFVPVSLNLPEAFACVAMFETGTANLDPSSLSNVMALSSGDSLFVAAPLLCDPYERPREAEIRRIAGNVGRPGLSLLIPPKDLRFAKQKLSSWGVVSHDDFNGEAEDNFQGTSVHLSFTGYELPLSQDNHGAQDSEIYFLETVVSVYDCGEWIADIDVLSAVADEELVRLHIKCTCHEVDRKHMQKPRTEILAEKFPGRFRLTSVDNWQELLEKPENTVVVRSHGNWLARLATTAVCVNLYGRTMVLPEEVCWLCVGDRTLSRPGIDSKRKELFLGMEPWPSVFIF